MNNKIQGVLTTWPFLLSLGTLIANDWWFKASFPGLITGKLSDFSGVAIVSLLLLASNPGRKLLIYVAVAVFFIWWKSPLSESFIDFISSLIAVRFGRVVDYSDCWALTVLPLCHYVATHQARFSISLVRYKQVLATPVAVATAFAIMGTSIIPTHLEYVVRQSSADVQMQRPHMLDAITLVAKKHGLSCKDCSSESDTGVFIGDGITMSYAFSSSNAVSFTIEAYPNGVFFGASGEEKANALRNSLKSLLAEQFEGLEYVEPLKGSRH